MLFIDYPANGIKLRMRSVINVFAFVRAFLQPSSMLRQCHTVLA